MAEIQANVMDIREFVNIQVQQNSTCMKYSNPVVVQAQYENSAAAALDRCKEFLGSGKFSMVRQVLCCTVLYFTVLYCTVLCCTVRQGDVFGFMVEHHAKQGQYRPALALLQVTLSPVA